MSRTAVKHIGLGVQESRVYSISKYWNQTCCAKALNHTSRPRGVRVGAEDEQRLTPPDCPTTQTHMLKHTHTQFKSILEAG